jgi:hypothetical protein
MNDRTERTAIVLQASALAIAIVGAIYVFQTLKKYNA